MHINRQQAEQGHLKLLQQSSALFTTCLNATFDLILMSGSVICCIKTLVCARFVSEQTKKICCVSSLCTSCYITFGWGQRMNKRIKYFYEKNKRTH